MCACSGKVKIPSAVGIGSASVIMGAMICIGITYGCIIPAVRCGINHTVRIVRHRVISMPGSVNIPPV